MGLREKLQGPIQSLREKLGAINDKTQGAAMATAGVLTRSTGLMGGGAEKVFGAEQEDTKNYNKIEPQSQIDANYRMGYKSDEAGNITERLPRDIREKLAKENPGAAPELLFEREGAQTAEAKPAMIEVKKDTPAFNRSNLVFQESNVGNGIPYVDINGESLSIDKVTQDLPEMPTQPITSLTITDATGSPAIITDPDRLATANQIAAVADAVAPEYKNYLLKLAFREGGLVADAFRGEKDNPGGGDDRGVFQINSKAFPSITKEMADDVRFATLWAISLIESANPTTGDGLREGQEKWYSNDWAKGASIDYQY